MSIPKDSNMEALVRFKNLVENFHNAAVSYDVKYWNNGDFESNNSSNVPNDDPNTKPNIRKHSI